MRLCPKSKSHSPNSIFRLLNTSRHKMAFHTANCSLAMSTTQLIHNLASLLNNTGDYYICCFPSILYSPVSASIQKQTNKHTQFLDLQLNISILPEFWDWNYLLSPPKHPSSLNSLNPVGSASFSAAVISFSFLPLTSPSAFPSLPTRDNIFLPFWSNAEKILSIYSIIPFQCPPFSSLSI